MRFERLCLERYGVFTDRTLDLRADAHLHVVLGANEAGKTSALNAIGDLLFGFGNITNYDFLHDKSALRIGARLRLADGSAISLRRRKGAKNTLLDEDDKPLAKDPLAPLLGSVTREIFFNEFGLTAEALRAGGRELLLAGGRLAETLAATSAQLSALAQLRARLEGEADALFGLRRSAGKEFYAALDQHEAADKRLREAIVTTDALGVAESSLKETQEKRDALGVEHDRIGRELARYERSLRTRPKLLRIDKLREELASFADLPPVSVETQAQWVDAQDRMTQIEAELEQLQLAEAEAAAAIAALTVDEPLLQVGEQIDKLREKLGAVQKAEDDLPRRREAGRIARAELQKAARRLGLASESELLTRQPPDPALALVRDLIGKRNAAERGLEEAASVRTTAQRELAEFEQNVANLCAAVDPTPFVQRLEAFVDIPGDADRHRRDSLALAGEQRTLADEAGRLDPPAGSPDDLALLALPDAARIDAARQLFAALEEEEKQLVALEKAHSAALVDIDEEIEALSRAGAVATREELNEARKKRNSTYEQLRDALEGPPVARRETFIALGEASREVDATADLLLSYAERAARFEAAQERRARELRLGEKLAAEQKELIDRKRNAQLAWSATWAASGVAPRPPQIMTRWHERVENILTRRSRLNERALETETLSLKLEANRAALLGLVADLGAAVDPSLPVEAFYRSIRAAVDKLQADWTEARTNRAMRDKAILTSKRAQENYARIELEMQRLLAQWPQALSAIGLDGGAGPAEAEAALTIWRDLPLQRSNFENEDRRIVTMHEDIAGFEAEVATIVESTAPELRDHGRREALDVLSKKLIGSRRARDQRQALHAAAQKRKAARAALQQKHAAAQSMLMTARTALALAEGAPLAPAFERLHRRGTLNEELAGALRDLNESGDGHDEQSLRAEQTDVDFEILSGAIERLKIERKQIVTDIENAATSWHEAEKSLDMLVKGRDAAGAASDKAEAGVQLLSVASRWLVRAAAARLAAVAIERHRAAVQDPLLTRASALFAIASNGAFAALGADYDETDTPMLVGVRTNAARVRVLEMSEGARDQLFLSLRLALLELRVAEPLPFIGDDLLASFDDARTACALGLLAEFGHSRQAIVFTHHRHVAEIAKELPNACVDVIEL